MHKISVASKLTVSNIRDMVTETSEEYYLTVWFKDMTTEICVSSEGDIEEVTTNTTSRTVGSRYTATATNITTKSTANRGSSTSSGRTWT